ncbi:hypothetical protein EV122DRAFT_278423 [Schizophyllum commune]
MPRTPITFTYTMPQCSAYGRPDNPTTSGDCQHGLVWQPSLTPALSNESYGLSGCTLGMPWDECAPALAACDYTRDFETRLPGTAQCTPAASIPDVPIPCDSRSLDMSIEAQLFPTSAGDPSIERLSRCPSLCKCNPYLSPCVCLPTQPQFAPYTAIHLNSARPEVGSQAQTEAARRRRNSSSPSRHTFTTCVDMRILDAISAPNQGVDHDSTQGAISLGIPSSYTRQVIRDETNCMYDEISFGSGVLLADVYEQISANTNPQYDGPAAFAYDKYGSGFWMDPGFLAGIMSPWPSLEENSMDIPPFQDLPPEIQGLLDDCDVGSENIRHHPSLLSPSLAPSSPSTTYSSTSSASISSDAITPDEILSSEGLQDVIDAAPSPAYLHGPFNADGQSTFVVSHEERLLLSSATASGPVDIAAANSVQHASTYRETVTTVARLAGALSRRGENYRTIYRCPLYPFCPTTTTRKFGLEGESVIRLNFSH